MFAIALQNQQYKTYILSDQTAQAQLEVVPERGGIITKWRIQDREILYLDAERFANRDLSVRGGIPILFPICGNLPENTYTYASQQYFLKQHGFARDLPWEVTDQQIQDSASLTLVLNSSDETRAVYPFDFQLTFTYQLKGHSLEIQQRYSNFSDKPMPFSTGLHPYFGTSDKTRLKFEIPAGEFQDQKTKKSDFFSGNFDFDLDEIDVAFQAASQSARVTDSARRLQLTLSYDESYPILVFWTLKGKDYYCLEPWSASRNALNTGERLIHLEPGATIETRVQLNVTFL